MEQEGHLGGRCMGGQACAAATGERLDARFGGRERTKSVRLRAGVPVSSLGRFAASRPALFAQGCARLLLAGPPEANPEGAAGDVRPALPSVLAKPKAADPRLVDWGAAQGCFAPGPCWECRSTSARPRRRSASKQQNRHSDCMLRVLCFYSFEHSTGTQLGAPAY